MDQTQEAETYRPLSKLAVAALGASLLGLLSLLLAELIALPIAATVLAAAALLRIRGSEAEMAGRGAAAFGLALGVFCTAAGVGNMVLHRQLLVAHARQYARQWLQMVAEDRLLEAHQLTLKQEDREASGANLEYYYRKIPPEVLAASNPFDMDGYPLESLREMFAAEPLKSVAEALQNGDRAEYVRTVGVYYEQHTAAVQMAYRLRDAGAEFLIGMQRITNRDTRSTSWRIQTLDYYK